MDANESEVGIPDIPDWEVYLQNMVRKCEEMGKPDPIPSPEDCEKFYSRRILELGFDDRNEKNTAILVRYFTQLRLGATKKGLLITGQTGRGKSFAARLMRRMFAIPTFNCFELVGKYQDDHGILDRVGKYEQDGRFSDVMLDDMGSERTVINFGDKFELVAEIVFRREIVFSEYGARTHITTNLTRKSISDRYGDRVMSRLQGMCHFVTFEGEDRRLS